MAVLDQPENPRIRTKVLDIDPEIDTALFRLTEKFRTGEMDAEGFQNGLVAVLQQYPMHPCFSEAIAAARSSSEQKWLVRRHVEHCRYTILFFKVDQNEVHPPHHHHNLVSTQIVVEGKIHLREYERIGRDDQGRLKVQLVRDDVLGPGDRFQASEWSRNVHWFSGEEGPAVVFNMNVRGYEPTLYNPHDMEAFGRRYIDPTSIDESGIAVCEEFDAAEAQRRFQGKPLTDFPLPPSVVDRMDMK